MDNWAEPNRLGGEVQKTIPDNKTKIDRFIYKYNSYIRNHENEDIEDILDGVWNIYSSLYLTEMDLRDVINGFESGLWDIKRIDVLKELYSEFWI